MSKLQNLIPTSFGYASIVSSAVFIALAPAFLRAPLPHFTARFHADPVSLLLVAMRELMLVMPAIMAVSTGLAWWALRKELPSARTRVLVASASCLLMSAPFFVADVAIVRYSLAGPVEFIGVLVLFVSLLSLGAVGLVAFGKRDAQFAASIQPEIKNEAQRIGALVPTA